MLQPFKQPVSQNDVLVEQWTRSRFELHESATVMVADVRCQVPGCPPIETIVAFWWKDSARYRFKVFKPLAEVVEADVPVKWLLPSLEDFGDLGCDCC